MFRLERPALVAVRQQHVLVVEHVERQVRGVALLGMDQDVGRLGPDLGQLQDRPDRDALPGRVELRPARHAVDVRGDRRAGQRQELVPGERERRPDQPVDAEVPRGQVGRGDAAVVEDRELLGQVLTRWDARRCRGILSAGPEEALEHGVLRAGAGILADRRAAVHDMTIGGWSTEAREPLRFGTCRIRTAFPRMPPPERPLPATGSWS